MDVFLGINCPKIKRLKAVTNPDNKKGKGEMENKNCEPIVNQIVRIKIITPSPL
ncbi:hypothetical protein THER_1544 [Thermodesulfovibrio sp. N1]|nr:hypothetical protein THER_1544 [Thermodesulfovibrio sp. N1]